MRMTREEAIEQLQYCKGLIKQNGQVYLDERDFPLLDMAIEALQADRPQGEWIDKGDYAECSICGAHSGTQFDGVEPIPLKTNFCPNCGVDMKSEVI